MEIIKSAVRKSLAGIAKGLNDVTRGKITPNQVTLSGLILHLPIAIFIAQGKLVLAGLLLIVFGLFDVLDGELARLQKSASNYGMFLDSVTDRIKEILIYMGIGAWIFYNHFTDVMFLVLIGALGVSLLISYLNAWGEAVIGRAKAQSNHKMNKTLRGGLMGFDVRMATIVIGLLFNRLDLALIVIFTLGSLTALQRLNSVLSRLKDA